MIMAPFYLIKLIINDSSRSRKKKGAKSKAEYYPERNYYAKDITDYDLMDGNEFEYAIADLLEKYGYSFVNVTRASGDDGLDIIASKNGQRVGFQCKCFSSPVGNHAVQEAFTGKTMYGCDQAVVVTNNFFTPAAIKTAQATGVQLWDRNKLDDIWKQIERNKVVSSYKGSFNEDTLISEKSISVKVALVGLALFVGIFAIAVFVNGINTAKTENYEQTVSETAIIEETEEIKDIKMKNIPIPDNYGSITLVATGAYALEVTNDSIEDNCIPSGKYELIPVYPDLIKKSEGEYAASWDVFVSNELISELRYLTFKSQFIGRVGGDEQHTLSLEVEQGQYVYVVDYAIDEKSIGTCEMCLISIE